MESTSQRYATFLRQWKKRHSYSYLHNQYRKFERSPKGKSGEGESFFLNKAGKERASALLHDNTKLQSLNQNPSHKDGVSSSLSSDSTEPNDLLREQMRASRMVQQPPKDPSHRRETQEQTAALNQGTKLLKTQSPSHQQQRRYKPRTIGLPHVNKSNTTPDHMVSPSDLADMEFWLLYGESAQSTARHFSYALLARIDQCLEVPAGTACGRSRAFKGFVEQRVPPFKGKEIIESRSDNEHILHVPVTGSKYSTSQRGAAKAKRKESLIYWNHSSDCADKYRLHILKFMKKAKKSRGLQEKSIKADETLATLNDRTFEKADVEEILSNSASPCSVGTNNISNSVDVPLKNIHDGKSCTLDDSKGHSSKKSVGPQGTKPSDLLMTNKLHLKSSKNTMDKKLTRPIGSPSSVVAVYSAASTKRNHDPSNSLACLPSAGSSVTVYLPRCPLGSDTPSSSPSVNNEEEERVWKAAEFQNKSEHQIQAGSRHGSKRVCEKNWEKDALSHKEASTEICDEKQDIISVNIRRYQTHSTENPRVTASPSFTDKLQRLNSASGVDSSRKCNQWLYEKCPK